MSAKIHGDRLGVRFHFDRQQRPTTPILARIRRRCTASWGLKGVALDIGPGESVALIGANGAGKTTLLRLVAGVLQPDAGSIEVRGHVGSLLSVEGGLLPRLTGRENCRLLGVMAGARRREAIAAVGDIEARASLGEAFDRPVSSYSQGMQARLGFAVVEQFDPEILLLDEVHEAVDQGFRAAVRERARRIGQRGGIVLAAGHDLDQLGSMCRTALLLDAGRIRAAGPFEDVAGRYRATRAAADGLEEGFLSRSRA